MFAWTASDMTGVPREVIDHHMAVCTDSRPVKQKIFQQAPEMQEFIVQEVEKLKKAKFIRVVIHAGGSLTLCYQRIMVTYASP